MNESRTRMTEAKALVSGAGPREGGLGCLQ